MKSTPTNMLQITLRDRHTATHPIAQAAQGSQLPRPSLRKRAAPRVAELGVGRLGPVHQQLQPPAEAAIGGDAGVGRVGAGVEEVVVEGLAAGVAAALGSPDDR